jgi:hypothetical protein
MCGRFTQNYTGEEVHAFLKVFGARRESLWSKFLLAQEFW